MRPFPPLAARPAVGGRPRTAARQWIVVSQSPSSVAGSPPPSASPAVVGDGWARSSLSRVGGELEGWKIPR